MKKKNVWFALIALWGSTLTAHSQTLSHEEELKCLSLLYVRDVFGDEKQKKPTEGGWSMPTPGEAVSPFESGEYLPKLNRIQTAAVAGNTYASYLMGELHASGICGLPQDEDLAQEYLDKARAYMAVSQNILIHGAQAGQPKDAMKAAYLFLKIGLLRYPYISEKDARIFFADRGNSEPADGEIRGFLANLQPPKEDLEKQLRDLLEMAQKIHAPFTQNELNELDNRAQDWVKRHS